MSDINTVTTLIGCKTRAYSCASSGLMKGSTVSRLKKALLTYKLPLHTEPLNSIMSTPSRCHGCMQPKVLPQQLNLSLHPSQPSAPVIGGVLLGHFFS